MTPAFHQSERGNALREPIGRAASWHDAKPTLTWGQDCTINNHLRIPLRHLLWSSTDMPPPSAGRSTKIYLRHYRRHWRSLYFFYAHTHTHTHTNIYNIFREKHFLDVWFMSVPLAQGLYICGHCVIWRVPGNARRLLFMAFLRLDPDIVSRRTRSTKIRVPI